MFPSLRNKLKSKITSIDTRLRIEMFDGLESELDLDYEDLFGSLVTYKGKNKGIDIDIDGASITWSYLAQVAIAMSKENRLLNADLNNMASMASTFDESKTIELFVHRYQRTFSYCFLTQDFLDDLALKISKRQCVEVGAGRGWLSYLLKSCYDINAVATDDHSWRISSDAKKCQRQFIHNESMLYETMTHDANCVIVSTWAPASSDIHWKVTNKMVAGQDFYFTHCSKHKNEIGTQAYMVHVPHRKPKNLAYRSMFGHKDAMYLHKVV